MKLIATLGDFDGRGEGRLVEVDLGEGRAREVLRWSPPAHLAVAGKGFTGASRWGGSLYVCTFNGILRISESRWAPDGLLTQPCFNDLHHVMADESGLWVANTGADRVDVFDLAGTYRFGVDLSPAWWMAARLGGASPARSGAQRAFQPGWSGHWPELVEAPVDEDYLLSAGGACFATRPVRDFFHPNHVCRVGHRRLVTVFRSRQVLDLATGQALVTLPGYPHDGCARADRLWLTTTDGQLIVCAWTDDGRLAVDESLQLFETTGRTGWCRGLHLAGATAAIGLTAIRRVPRVRWCDRPFEATETSVVLVDCSDGRLLQRVDLKGFGGHPKIFSLLGAP